MAFYSTNLENLIMNYHTSLDTESNELFIISGYVGPKAVELLVRNNKDFDKITVIAGMYPRGVNKGLYTALSKLEDEYPMLHILYTTSEIHSKIYIWKKNNIINGILMGSANFSQNGLKTDYRESLADLEPTEVPTIKNYCDYVLNISTTEPLLTSAQKNNINPEYTFKVNSNIQELSKLAETSSTLELPLYAEKKGKPYVPDKSGLNWGNSNGHVAEGDAYIRIPKNILKVYPDFFPKYDENYTLKVKSNKKRVYAPIELIWDDGTVMEASSEGEQYIDGKTFPKQLTSFSSLSRAERGNISVKSIMGRYLRKRLGIDDVNHVITLEELERYGRVSISISKISDGVYYCDFSV